MSTEANNENTMNNEAENTLNNAPKNEDTWTRLRELILLQLKLILDTIRDFMLMPVAWVCFILDFGERKAGEPSHWERLMSWGRKSDRLINLFKHEDSHNDDFVTVDDAMDIIENTLRKDKESPEVAEKAITAVKNAFNKRKPD